MAVETLELQIKATGEEQAARAIDKMSTSVDRLEGELTQVKRAQDNVARSTGTLTQNMGKFAPLAGIASQSLGQFSGTAGRLLGIAGQTTSAVSSLGTGLGAVGVAAGAAVGGVAALGVGVKALADEFEKARDEQVFFVRGIEDGFNQNGQIDRALMNFRKTSKDVFGPAGWEGFLLAGENAARGFGNVIGTMVEEWSLRLRLFVTVLSEVKSALEAGDIARAANAISAGGATASSLNASLPGRLATAYAAGEQRSINPNANFSSGPARRRGGGGGGRPDAEMRDDPRAGGALFPGQGVNFASAGAQELERFNVDSTQANAWAEYTRQMADYNAANMKAYEDRIRLAQEEQELFKENLEIAGEMGEVIGGTLVSSFDSALKGQKSLGKAIKDGFKDMLLGLAKSEAILGFSDLAKGIAAAATGNAASATGLFTASAQHFAAAALAGVGGAALGGGGGGGGGGAARASAQPTRSTSSDSGEGSKTYVINFGAPVLTASTLSELGLQIQRATDAAQSRYGS